ncbi:MAG: RsmB/NOP family class I SAM-dependent RNA methyltransferase [Ancalomicrobiaceae bacterium]|nr:RsmB/NOP family class I SAM-dependent RNA methyltransferase [Ancalomicrobiaceae bacterium]
MRDGGRIEAAIAVLADIETHHRPVSEALKDWGVKHRFAGSGDRAAIGNLVYDALRRRSSFAHIVGDQSPRAAILAAYAIGWGRGVEALTAALAEPHAPSPLSDDEAARLAAADVSDAPEHVAADLPEWLMPSLSRVYGIRLAEEGRALTERAPVDLRVNTLKGDRGKALKQLGDLPVTPSRLSPVGIRVAIGSGPARAPHVESEPAYLKGLIEIQDEGSQIAALVAAPTGDGQVLDLCAGAGGKSLALAALMGGKGQIYAYDSEKRRMHDLYDRTARAGARNIQPRSPGRDDVLADLLGKMDLVLVDAPCSGTGTWRRRPDAKWRLTEAYLTTRMEEQDAVLDDAAGFVKVGGGRLVYITCSVLAEENEDRVEAFMRRHAGFGIVDPLERLAKTDAATAAKLRPFVHIDERIGPVLRLTPATAGTDGFFVAVMARD